MDYTSVGSWSLAKMIFMLAVLPWWVIPTVVIAISFMIYLHVVSAK